ELAQASSTQERTSASMVRWMRRFFLAGLPFRACTCSGSELLLCSTSEPSLGVGAVSSADPFLWRMVMPPPPAWLFELASRSAPAGGFGRYRHRGRIVK